MTAKFTQKEFKLTMQFTHNAKNELRFTEADLTELLEHARSMGMFNTVTAFCNSIDVRYISDGD